MALRIFLLRTINMTKLQETCNIHIHKMGYFPHCSPNCGVYPSASIKFEVKVCTYLSNACLHVTWWVGKNHSFRPTQDPMSYSGFVHFNDTFTFPSEWCTYVYIHIVHVQNLQNHFWDTLVRPTPKTSSLTLSSDYVHGTRHEEKR